MLSASLLLLFLVLFLALAFDFINGFHDTANAIATSVSTGVLTARRAIAMAAVLNFAGAMLVGTAVAKTIGKGIIDPQFATQWLVASALLGAIVWNLLTWWWELPSSSSHALIGGIVGAGVAGHGWKTLHPDGLEPILGGLLLSPLIGFGAAFAIMVALLWAVRRLSPHLVSSMFRVLQVMSAAFMSFSHGTNDAQKSMGIITLALMSYGAIDDFNVPIWVMFICAVAMGLGTSAGGWKIIKTMGTKIVKMQPIHGFAAETAAALTIVCASRFGLPISTTHIISGSIMGVGATRRLSAVRWGVAGNMVIAWILTIPITAALSAAFYMLGHYYLGLS
ncbi:MAG: inorganic phosphate transporter [Candidatus Sericytochromatia bacterium]|nr:inorganic phosphate transporter [Candidatus Sericytochromatia bacterium]